MFSLGDRTPPQSNPSQFESHTAERGRRAEAYLRSGDEALLEPVEEPPWFTGGPLANRCQPTATLDAAQAAFLRSVGAAVPQAHWFGFDADSSDQDYLELSNAATDDEQLRPAMARREQIMQTHVTRGNSWARSCLLVRQNPVSTRRATRPVTCRRPRGAAAGHLHEWIELRQIGPARS